jgi:hypothetical protein
VSNYHAYPATQTDLAAAPARAAIDAMVALRSALLTAAGAIHTALVGWWTRRYIARLSDHMLRDFGFERDWDGSIRSLRDAD